MDADEDDRTELATTIAELRRRVETDDLLTRISTRFINSAVDQIGPGIDASLAELGALVGADRAFVFIVPELPNIELKVDAGHDPNDLVSMAHQWCSPRATSIFDEQGRLAFEVDNSVETREADAWFKERLMRHETIRVDSLDDLSDALAPLKRRLAGWGVVSRIVVPIVTEGVATGMFGFDTTVAPRSWDDETEQVLKRAGPIFANAVLRKRSARALQEAHDELERKVQERTRELREKQAQLVQTEKLASLGQLVAGVAHEINTPLGAISSNSDTTLRALDRILTLLADGTLGDSKPISRARKLLGTLTTLGRVSEDAIGRITTLVRSLRSFARLDQAELAEVNLHDGLNSTLALLHHKLKGRVEVVRDYGELPLVTCYANQINQVFMNLLVNASQAIDGTGRITVRSRPDGDRIRIEIGDTGRGIEPENLSRIFDPGFTTKGVGVGTGLGLSIVHQILERHHGLVDLASSPGEGTTVTIRLPCTPPPGDGPDR